MRDQLLNMSLHWILSIFPYAFFLSIYIIGEDRQSTFYSLYYYYLHDNEHIQDRLSLSTNYKILYQLLMQKKSKYVLHMNYFIF